MDFLRDVPAVALCDEMSTQGGNRTYLAGVFDKRPPIDDIKRNVEWVGALQANLTALMAKPSIPVKSVAVYIDEKGAFLVATFKRPIQKANASTAVDFAMRGFPAPQFGSILKSLHAFDELDKERIEAMQTVRSLQVLCGTSAAPPPPVVARHMSYEELMLEPPEQVRTQSLAEFLAESEREDVLVLPDLVLWWTRGRDRRSSTMRTSRARSSKYIRRLAR